MVNSSGETEESVTDERRDTKLLSSSCSIHGIFIEAIISKNGYLMPPGIVSDGGERKSILHRLSFSGRFHSFPLTLAPKPYYYAQYNREKGLSDIEIDFIISNNCKMEYMMYPVEVKSGTNYSIVLQRFMERYRNRIGKAYA